MLLRLAAFIDALLPEAGLVHMGILLVIVSLIPQDLRHYNYASRRSRTRDTVKLTVCVSVCVCVCVFQL